jgi:hypothetical protein
MYDAAVLEAVARIEAKYTAIPGLRLTVEQLNRLCQAPKDVCESALEALTRAGYLQASDGTFFRVRQHTRRAIIA